MLCYESEVRSFLNGQVRFKGVLDYGMYLKLSFTIVDTSILSFEIVSLFPYSPPDGFKYT